MKRKSNITLFFTTFLLLLMFAFPASAATKPIAPTKLGIYKILFPIIVDWEVKGFNEKADKFIDVKSSNPAVAEVTFDEYNYSDPELRKYLTVTTHKTGSTTVSFKIQRGSKTWSYKTKLTVYKFAAPFKTLKIGGKSYLKKFKQSGLGISKAISGKLSVTPASGWKIKKIQLIKYYISGKYKVLKTYKNGDMVSLRKNQAINFEMYNAKRNQTMNLSMYYQN